MPGNVTVAQAQDTCQEAIAYMAMEDTERLAAAAGDDDLELPGIVRRSDSLER